MLWWPNDGLGYRTTPHLEVASVQQGGTAWNSDFGVFFFCFASAFMRCSGLMGSFAIVGFPTLFFPCLFYW